MKKRKNIIISAITCMFSIFLMMFGVYAASSPSVDINGQVSYTARDASVLVQGKMYGADGYQTGEYKTVADATLPQPSDVLTNSVSQYVDYTSADQNKTTLAVWNLGNDLKFYEDQSGIRKVNLFLKFTNISNYPILATAQFENQTSTNVNIIQSPTDGTMAMTTKGEVGSDCEMHFLFEVQDDSKNAKIEFKLVITIEKTILQDYTATFMAGEKAFSNQSNATSYDVANTTILTQAPELYHTENEQNRRVASWYDNSQCQGDPIKFPYVLHKNKTLYPIWEQNVACFNFYDYGNDIQVMFDGYPALRAKNLNVAQSVLSSQDCFDTVKVDGTSYGVYKQNILGFEAYNNLLANLTTGGLYIVPGYTYQQLVAMVASGDVAKIYEGMVGGYMFGSSFGSGALALGFASIKAVENPNVQIFNSGKLVQSQIGFCVKPDIENLPKYTATFHSGTEYEFITGTENITDENGTPVTQYTTTQTVTKNIAILTKFLNTESSGLYSSVGEFTTGNGDKIFVAEWYDNPQLSGEPISLPYTLTKNTDFYAKWEYNTKIYTIDENATNIEIFYKGKKILQTKDTSGLTLEQIPNTAIFQIAQNDSVEYVDQKFKIGVALFFQYSFYQEDWNIVDYSKATGVNEILENYFYIKEDNNRWRIEIGRWDDIDSLKDNDLKVYVNGVEADYVWENVIYD